MSSLATETKLDERALRELERHFGGQLVRPGQPAHDAQRRVWNGSIDRFPALIARCSGLADVMAAVVREGRRPGGRRAG